MNLIPIADALADQSTFRKLALNRLYDSAVDYLQEGATPADLRAVVATILADDLPNEDPTNPIIMH